MAKGIVTKLGWSKVVHSLTGVWHSATNGNFVGDLATELGNVVQDIDVNYKFSGYSEDMDIVTSDFNVEVKLGVKMKLAQSSKNQAYAKVQGKGYILYMPEATDAQINEAVKQKTTKKKLIDD